MEQFDKICSYKEVKKLDGNGLKELCRKLRALILDVTLKNGGHLASSLGAVEINAALLKAFDPDVDKILFDVGHQSYAYKILTQGAERFATLRQKGGMAGFPRLDESRYNAFTTGHSSTSVSAAMGYAKARDLRGENHHVVAVIGDGALLNGVSFEALNNMEPNNSKVIIVLNDNRMSIDRRVGGAANHLAQLAVNSTYKKFKAFVKKKSENSGFRPALENWKNKLKAMLLPANIFEQFGISYWGPFDGHNAEELAKVFELAKQYDKSLVIHVITKKGKGFKETEENPSYFHGVGSNSSLQIPCGSGKLAWSKAAADCLTELAEKDDKIFALTAAMKDGTKLGEFAERFPERFIDTGIAEEHTLVYAAGLAAGGMRPAVCIYSTFLQRAADQVMHDICLPKLPVLLCIDRSGLVGNDGETHHGLFDIAWLKALPNMTIAAPRDEKELKFMIDGWAERKIPMAVRYPRGNVPAFDFEKTSAEWGKLQLISEGKDMLLIAAGDTLPLMLETAEKLKADGRDATVVDLRFIKPLDREGLVEQLKKHSLAVTAEDASLKGGIGEEIAALVSQNLLNCKIISVGVADRFISHASPAEQWEECGMTSDNIIRLINES